MRNEKFIYNDNKYHFIYLFDLVVDPIKSHWRLPNHNDYADNMNHDAAAAEFGPF